MNIMLNWKLSKCKIFSIVKIQIFFTRYSDFSYDQRMDDWRPGPSMRSPRGSHAFVSDGARLFAIGGYDAEWCVSFFFQLFCLN